MGTLRIGGVPYLNLFSETVPTFCLPLPPNLPKQMPGHQVTLGHDHLSRASQFGNQLPLDQWFPKSVCPHATTRGSHWTDFHKIGYLSNVRKSVENVQAGLKSDKNNWYFI